MSPAARQAASAASLEGAARPAQPGGRSCGATPARSTPRVRALGHGPPRGRRSTSSQPGPLGGRSRSRAPGPRARRGTGAATTRTAPPWARGLAGPLVGVGDDPRLDGRRGRGGRRRRRPRGGARGGPGPAAPARPGRAPPARPRTRRRGGGRRMRPAGILSTSWSSAAASTARTSTGVPLRGDRVRQPGRHVRDGAGVAHGPRGRVQGEQQAGGLAARRDGHAGNRSRCGARPRCGPPARPPAGPPRRSRGGPCGTRGPRCRAGAPASMGAG